MDIFPTDAGKLNGLGNRTRTGTVCCDCPGCDTERISYLLQAESVARTPPGKETGRFIRGILCQGIKPERVCSNLNVKLRPFYYPAPFINNSRFERLRIAQRRKGWGGFQKLTIVNCILAAVGKQQTQLEPVKRFYGGYGKDRRMVSD